MQDIILTLQSVADIELNLYWNTSQCALLELDHIKRISLSDLACQKKQQTTSLTQYKEWYRFTS